MSVYAGKSYWLATYNWENQNYPFDTKVYTHQGGFSNGYVPMFIVIGYKNKVYWNHNSDGFRGALRQAIDEIVSEGVWVKNPIEDQVLMFNQTCEINISSVFADIDGNPITVTIESNDDPNKALVELNGNTLTITANSSSAGATTLTLKGTALEFEETDEFVINVFDPNLYLIENFETGDFSLLPWYFGGSAAWMIEPVSPYEGTYCARSEDIIDNQRADMSVNIEYPISGNISFNYKTSSEGNYDYLKFYIDAIERGKWSGVTTWTEVSFPVTEGDRNFRWSFEKDGSYLYGSDCVWVDNIIFEGGVFTSINDEQPIINNSELYQNYPNPFNPNTNISFSLKKTEQVKLFVYNHSGQLVSKLVNRSLSSGIHNIDFDASDLNSGIYYYTLKTSESSKIKKMILIK